MKFHLAAVACLAMITGAALAQTQASSGATAEEMLGAIKAVKYPAYDNKKGMDKAYVDAWKADYAKATEEKAKLILAFFRAYPEHEETVKLMNQRWSGLTGMDYPPAKAVIAAAIADVDAILKENPPQPVKQAGYYWRASYEMTSFADQPDKVLGVAEKFAKAYPTDERGASLLDRAASGLKDQKAQAALYRRIAKDYPTSISGKFAGGVARRIDSMGKPFELSFTDAISGKTMSIADFKGKVVVIDFWATWCGPCVAEMPNMKKLWAEYKDKGLQIVGISLDNPEDQGGLKALKDFVDKNEIGWPQYYQGKQWYSEFSMGWGINSIPRLFILDKDGKLIDAEGRQDLENKIKSMLGK